jgi:hypothetical protein
VIRLALTLTCSILLACDGLAPDDDDPDDDDAASMESDFEPASGAAPSPSADPMVEGPWNGRFMTAVSEDGLDFKDMVCRHAVLQAVRPSRILSNVATDTAGHLA